MKRTSRLFKTVAAALVVLSLALAVFYFHGGTGVAHATTSDDGIGTPEFKSDQSASNFSSNANTIPYWSSSFTDPTNGVTYPFTMVGTNPAKGDVSTTIPTVIIPFRFSFVQSADPNNTVLDGSVKSTLTAQSPMFQKADIGAAANATASTPPTFPGVAPANARPVNEPSDVTQVGDAIYRAQWGKSGTGYHTLLGQPTILPTVSYSVPSNQGFIEIGSRSQARIGLMDYHWFSNRLNETMRNLHISPNVLPIFLVYNTFLYETTPSNCCVLGYHGATTSANGNGQQQVNTYMFASYSDPGIFRANPGDAFSYVQDIHGLSHEVQEWMDDPFVNNSINPWVTPTAPQYGCTSDLETGDPVVGYGFTIHMPNGVDYHPEDEVHYSWFAREKPSRAAQGYFTYLNNYSDVAHGC
ncbi:hypothetical protein [Ktedonobacter racemifer]|uniref:Uncharacterized protein n=1 Tax=Ktedonobacter racemifer DSM 44963 TaxID=485913 RepID=D6TFI1_KTERA|nr:hypothetical protein [Ktedonobacter racemifer]EFH88661.1 conserved hypothetical protein [Ktedonobacter racemifer DSM 44963]